ncbi:MAG: hypothetical protein H0T92_01305, partial [Pyrinomonadaceae bacterium]|nr:hypothetical protein [Pyrinomonadaceae bacterium]
MSKQVQVGCVRAREQEEGGNYEAACQELEQWWQIGERPQLDGLDYKAAAELLLRAGTLSGWIGSAHQIAGAQE